MMHLENISPSKSRFVEKVWLLACVLGLLSLIKPTKISSRFTRGFIWFFFAQMVISLFLEEISNGFTVFDSFIILFWGENLIYIPSFNEGEVVLALFISKFCNLYTGLSSCVTLFKKPEDAIKKKKKFIGEGWISTSQFLTNLQLSDFIVKIL